MMFEKLRLRKKGVVNGESIRREYNNYNRSNNKPNFISNFYINKLCLLAIFILLMFVLIVQSVSAIGITPGRTTLNFEPNTHNEIPFSIVNTEHKNMSIKISVRGDLAEYITLDQDHAEFLSLDDSKQFNYVLDLPARFEKPGMYEAEIVALEVPEDFEEAGAFVGATVAVVTQLHVYIPYPNKYVDAEIKVIESGEEENTFFLIPMINRGKLDIDDVRVILDIYSSSNEKVASIESDSISLKSLKRSEFMLEWPVDVNAGTYKAVATILYDGEVTKKEIEFNVGKMALEVKEIIIKDFQLGGVAKFDTLVENKWSGDLKNVYLNIIVFDNKKEIMADFKSQTYDMDALGSVRMVAYWDTEGVNTGTYDGKLILKYGKYNEKSIERNVKIKVTREDIVVFGVTGQVITKGAGKVNINNLLIILVVVLVIGNIIWFVIVKKLLKRKK